jgi:hypothetical protein
MSGRDWDLFAIDGALNEAEPSTEDLETLARWYERKATAAALLRQHALDCGDAAGADTAADLEQKATWAAAKLRRHRDT